MGLKDLFGKKQADPAPEGTPLAETTHAQIVDAGGIAVATVLCERYSEHEAKPIEHDLLDAAARCAHKLVIDMSKVAMLASAGIGSLISLHHACAKAGGRLVICALDPQIAQMLKLTRMDKMLTIVESRDAAAQALR
jgi:anti-anti-sigma factor|tara:strand:+ start:3379 stop:3789 length:411 start_codon:yes stop_codon:yes gene_type:complete